MNIIESEKKMEKKNLEFRIGAICREADNLDVDLALGRAYFIVYQPIENVLELYINEIGGQVSYSEDVVSKFKLEESKVLGGGKAYISKDKVFYLGNHSEFFGGCPKEALEGFIPELKKTFLGKAKEFRTSEGRNYSRFTRQKFEELGLYK